MHCSLAQVTSPSVVKGRRGCVGGQGQVKGFGGRVNGTYKSVGDRIP